MIKNRSIGFKYQVFFLIFILFFLFGLWWIAISLLFFLLIDFLISFILKKIERGLLINILKISRLLLYIVILFIGFRTFIIDVFYIPSSSMNDTLFEKDVILVNKLSYGPICPFFINQFLKKTEDYEKIRLSGLDRVKQGDVLVFEDTKDGFFFVKRCIGRSGDIFEISNGDIYVNNNLYVEPKTVKELYSFKVRNIHGLLDKCDSLGVSIQKSSKGRYIAFLSSKSIEIIKNDIDSLKEESNVFNKGTDNRLFPSLMRKSLIYGWNLNNYGPILIPQKGMSIELDDYNFMIYMSTLTKYEEVKVEKKGKNIYLNGKISSKYTFKRNYYFVIGDNRKQSYDSRFFGFLPEEEIVGKVSCVLFSKKDNSLQLNRIFKKV